MEHKDEEVLERIEYAYNWAKNKVIVNGEPMTPELATMLMLGYHVLGEEKGGLEQAERKHSGTPLTEKEAKERIKEIKESYNHRGITYTEEDIKRVISTYPQFKNYPFWDIYFILNYSYISMYDTSFPDKIYLKAGLRMLERMDDIKHFAYTV